MNEIKAIETEYKGYRFRSRLEARYAVFFDSLEVEWQYETEGYDIPGEGRYLPDFWLPQRKMFVEVKPSTFKYEPMAMYLGGKMNPPWRCDMRMRGHLMIGPDEYLKHSPGMHLSSGGETPLSILNECLGYLRASQVFFAWIDTADAYGTLVELGLAKGWGLDTYVAFHDRFRYESGGIPRTTEGYFGKHGFEKCHDIWFAGEAAGKVNYANTPQEAFDYWFYRIGSDEERKCQQLSTMGDASVLMACGDPLDSTGVEYQGGDRVLMGKFWPRFDCGAIEFERAGKAARGARFEHGETPNVRRRSAAP